MVLLTPKKRNMTFILVYHFQTFNLNRLYSMSLLIRTCHWSDNRRRISINELRRRRRRQKWVVKQHCVYVWIFSSSVACSKICLKWYWVLWGKSSINLLLLLLLSYTPNNKIETWNSLSQPVFVAVIVVPFYSIFCILQLNFGVYLYQSI